MVQENDTSIAIGDLIVEMASKIEYSHDVRIRWLTASPEPPLTTVISSMRIACIQLDILKRTVWMPDELGTP